MIAAVLHAAIQMPDRMTPRPVIQDVLITLFGTAAGLVAVALIVLLAMWTLAPFILYGIYVRVGQVRDLLASIAARGSEDNAGPRIALDSSDERRGPMIIAFLLVASIVVVVVIVFSK